MSQSQLLLESKNIINHALPVNHERRFRRVPLRLCGQLNHSKPKSKLNLLSEPVTLPFLGFDMDARVGHPGADKPSLVDQQDS